MDCQDWVVWFMEHMVQRKLISADALQTTKNAMDIKVALMAAPTGGSPPAETAQNKSTARDLPMTASSLRRPCALSQQGAAPTSSSASGRARVGASQWNAQRSRFERYNNATRAWEYLDPQRVWMKFA